MEARLYDYTDEEIMEHFLSRWAVIGNMDEIWLCGECGEKYEGFKAEKEAEKCCEEFLL